MQQTIDNLIQNSNRSAQRSGQRSSKNKLIPLVNVIG